MSHRIDVSWSGGSVAVLTFSDPARCNQLCWAAVDALAQRLYDVGAAGGPDPGERGYKPGRRHKTVIGVGIWAPVLIPGFAILYFDMPFLYHAQVASLLQKDDGLMTI